MRLARRCLRADALGYLSHLRDTIDAVIGAAVQTRSDFRRVVALALPALVVLAAEPLYVLVDTAIVGHLGGTALASLAIGGSVMTFAAWLGVVLAYGTTGRAARLFGAGDRPGAVVEGVQASWIALVAGLAIAVAAQFLAGPVTRTLAGSDGDVAQGASTWLRIAALGAPGLCSRPPATAGCAECKTRAARSRMSSALICSRPCCVRSWSTAFGSGLTGSAIANVTAQTAVGSFLLRC